MSNSDSQRTFRVYSVIPREGKDDYWLNLGLAFPHQDGKGFNVMLQAFPINPKLVLRRVEEDEEKESADDQRKERREPGRERTTGARAGARR